MSRGEMDDRLIAEGQVQLVNALTGALRRLTAQVRQKLSGLTS